MDNKHSEREAFEKQWSSDGRYPRAIERSGDGYKFSVVNHDWFTWKLAWQAALASMPTVSREELTALVLEAARAGVTDWEDDAHTITNAILARFPHLESRG